MLIYDLPKVLYRVILKTGDYIYTATPVSIFHAELTAHYHLYSGLSKVLLNIYYDLLEDLFLLK